MIPILLLSWLIIQLGGWVWFQGSREVRSLRSQLAVAALAAAPSLILYSVVFVGGRLWEFRMVYR